MLSLYNTLTNRQESFHKQPGETVTVYTCGPTVYGRQHIGNFSSFLLADLLIRWLETSGYTVKHAKNITDVGHLVGDDSADATGEDKIEKQAKKESIDPLAVAKKYADEYIADEAALQLRTPDERPYATQYIHAMLDIVKDLLQKEYAYETDDGYYFEVTKYAEYGKLSGNKLDQNQAGARIAIDDHKRHPADFALWKKCVGENAHHLLRWSFETGKKLSGDAEDATAGFPGWHIECSAMVAGCLGQQIDIHTGGEDNIFPHHECEIAQSESSFGTAPFAHFWVHRRRISMGTEKMSKSLGNILTIDDIQTMGYSPLDLRYYFLSVHYRTQLQFSEEGLYGASRARKRIQSWVDRRGEPEVAYSDGSEPTGYLTGEVVNEYKQKFIDSMNDDLNTPAALASIFECMQYCRTVKVSGSDDLDSLDEYFKIIQSTFYCFYEKGIEVPEEVLKLAKDRKQAREDGDYAKSDELREAIAKLGFTVKDTAEGQVIE